MADQLRQFRCVTQAGPEVVDIMDVIVVEGLLYLVVKGERDEPYVFELASRQAMRAAHPARARHVLALHSEEVLRWQETTSS